jgi:enoyl-CoA hydratase/carnithine racemase
MKQGQGNADGRIVTELRGKVFLIGIDRPKKLNGFSLKMLRELGEAYTAFQNNIGAWVALLYAEGPHFTAGLQLDQVGPAMQRGEELWPAGSIDPFSLREPKRSKPVVAAVQGITYTIGIELMLAADVVVAAHDSRFSQLEVKRGIMATGGATLRMAERAGWGNAQRYLLTGDEFDAATALRFGFVQEVVPAGQQFDHALAIAERIAAQAPLAVRATLASTRKFYEQGQDAAVAEFRAVQQRLSSSEDAKEGVQSFIEKRAGRFAGK